MLAKAREKPEGVTNLGISRSFDDVAREGGRLIIRSFTMLGRSIKSRFRFQSLLR